MHDSDLQKKTYYVSYRGMILVLWSGGEIRIELDSVEQVERNWIES